MARTKSYSLLIGGDTVYTGTFRTAKLIFGVLDFLIAHYDVRDSDGVPISFHIILNLPDGCDDSCYDDLDGGVLLG